jgi:hypothetical protein
MRKVWVWALAFALLAAIPFVFADNGADWFSVPIHYRWDLSMAGACTEKTQCLVHLLGNASYDGDLERVFRFSDYKLGPRCVNDTQYLLDYYCDQGNWTTRTKHVALQLLKLAEDTSETNFTLFCGSYDQVLNRFDYLSQNVLVSDYFTETCTIQTKIVPCVNNVCVLRTQSAVAIGTTLNIPVDDSTRSFLFALNKTKDLCSGVQSGAEFASCGQNIWYNPAIKGIIYLPSGSLSPPTDNTKSRIRNPLLSLSYYAMSVLHNAANPGMNFIYFPKTRLFNNIYAAQVADRAVFGFLEEGLRPEYTLAGGNSTEIIPLDYIGVRYSGIRFFENNNQTCLNLIKAYDSKAFCENQTSSGFNVIARHRCPPELEPEDCKGSSPIVGVWPALTGKLRP